MSKSIAVLLTVFNRKECTLKCLQLLKEQRLPNDTSLEIYVVDGGSTDGTVDAICELYPGVNVEVREGVYWNRGMYAAWQWAATEKKFDYFLWMNDDTFIYRNCIFSLLQDSSNCKDQAIIVGATLDTKTRSKQTYGGRLSNGKFPTLGKAVEVNHFNGNIVLIPSAVYDVLGNLDPYYTHSKGDFDYGVRAKKAGIKMIQAAKAMGECDVHPHMDKWCDPRVPFVTRWKLMHKPNGMPPQETFHLNRKLNLISAICGYITIHLRCFFPWIWVKSGKMEIH